MDKKTTNVYETTNYSKIKKMLDNREVSPQRIAKIVKSIKDAKIHKQKIEQHKKERMAV